MSKAKGSASAGIPKQSAQAVAGSYFNSISIPHKADRTTQDNSKSVMPQCQH